MNGVEIHVTRADGEPLASWTADGEHYLPPELLDPPSDPIPTSALSGAGRAIRERAASVQRARAAERQERQIAEEERDRNDRQKNLGLRLRFWGLPEEEAEGGWLPLGSGWWLQASIDFQHGLALYGDCPHCGEPRVLFAGQVHDLETLAGFPDAITEPLYDHADGSCLWPRNEDGEPIDEHRAARVEPPPVVSPLDRLADALLDVLRARDPERFT